MKKIRRFLEFMKEEKGIGVVEVILILVGKLYPLILVDNWCIKY